MSHHKEKYYRGEDLCRCGHTRDSHLQVGHSFCYQCVCIEFREKSLEPIEEPSEEESTPQTRLREVLTVLAKAEGVLMAIAESPGVSRISAARWRKHAAEWKKIREKVQDLDGWI